MAKAAAKNTSMIPWDEQLAKDAEIAADMEAGVGGGAFFSLKAGILSFDGNEVPDGKLACVVTAAMLENVFYEGAYDENNITGPKCFAFGFNEADMVPHEVVVAAGTQQAEACSVCPHNQWGSANTGKGKACGNRRRLALIPAGEFNAQGQFEMIEDPEHYKTAEIAFMKIPPTALKGYAAFVKQLAGNLKRPPHGVFTKITVRPNQKKQIQVTFEAMENVPNELMGVIMERHAEAKTLIDFPYTIDEDQEEEAEPAPAPRRPAAPAPRKAVAPAPRRAPAPVPAPRKAVAPAPRRVVPAPAPAKKKKY